MLYLIGGSPRGGKSILSRRLSKELNVPYIPTDNLRLVVLPYFKVSERSKSFPFIKMFDAAAIDKFFLSYSGKEQLKADLKEAKSIWPGIKSLVDYLLVCKADYIIEGIHLLPSLVKQFRGNKDIKIVFLAKTDEDKIYEGLFKNRNNCDWLTDNTDNTKIIRLAAEAVSEYGKYFVKEADEYGFKCFDTGDNFTDKIKQAAEYLKN